MEEINWRCEYGMLHTEPNPVFDLANNNITTSDNGVVYSAVDELLEEVESGESNNRAEKKVFWGNMYSIHREEEEGLFLQKPFLWDSKDPASRDNILAMSSMWKRHGLDDFIEEIKISPRYLYTAGGVDAIFLLYLKDSVLSVPLLWLHSISCFWSCLRPYKLRPDIFDNLKALFTGGKWTKPRKIHEPSGAQLVWMRLEAIRETEYDLIWTRKICDFIIEKTVGNWGHVFHSFHNKYIHYPIRVRARKIWSEK